MPVTAIFCVIQKLIRKDGEYHSSRIIDGKDVQTNQNLQPKKKHKKSSHKVKEKVEVLIPHMDMDDDGSLRVQKNFICDHCYGAFRSSYHLKRHILTHTGENMKAVFCFQKYINILWRFSVFNLYNSELL